jgi:hypothetical protein
MEEYSLKEAERLLVIPGSRNSGGFGLGSLSLIRRSPLGSVGLACPDLAGSVVPEAQPVEHRGKPYCWVGLRHGEIRLTADTLKRYGIAIGDDLLVIRGSGLALGFAVRGPIVEEARRHPELELFAATA